MAGENDHTYIRNINTTSVSGGGTDTVTVDLTTGLLGHLSSSRRYKENIKPMESTSEALYQQAGFLDPDEHSATNAVEEAIRLDDRLSEDQKETLLGIYRGLVRGA